MVNADKTVKFVVLNVTKVIKLLACLGRSLEQPGELILTLGISSDSSL